MNTLQQTILTPAMIAFSLSTVCGVFLHDTHLDKVFPSALHKAITQDAGADSSVKISTHPHTHGVHARLVRERGDISNRALPRDRNRRAMTHKSMTRTNNGDSFHIYLSGQQSA